MRSNDQFAVQREADKRKRAGNISDEPDEMEMWLDHKKLEINTGLKAGEETFRSVMSSGINTEQSVFDRQAVFKVGGDRT